MRTTSTEQDLTLRVRQIRWESDGVVSLELTRLDHGELPEWAPGSHLDLALPGAITRQYSLCGSPADRDAWRIAVLREPHSRGGSVAVHERLRPGDHIDVVGPRNNFVLEPAANYLFVAGGIGITPILPMIESADRAGSRWSLLYGGRTRSTMAFLDELTRHGSLVDVQAQDEVGLPDLDGYLGSPRPDTLIYCCGPEGLLRAVEARCAHWPAGALHVERFAAKPRPDSDPGTERDFEVELAKSGRTIVCPAGKTILDALESEGVDPPNSCREGICGTCETVVLDGVPDHRDSLLSDEERSANKTMMICVGRALSRRIVLDM